MILIFVILGLWVGYQINTRLKNYGLSRSLIYIFSFAYASVSFLAAQNVKFSCLALQVLFFELCLIPYILIGLPLLTGTIVLGAATGLAKLLGTTLGLWTEGAM